MSTSFSVQRVGNITVIAIVLALILNASFMFWLITQLENNQKRAKIISQTAGKAYETKYHITEIRRILTNVVATGESNELTKAEEHYQKTQKLLSETSVLLPESNKISNANNQKLMQFYEAGKLMAESHIAQNHKAGNAQIKQAKAEFDSNTDSLTASMNNYVLNITEQNRLFGAELTQKIVNFKILVTILNIVLGLTFVLSRLRFNRKLFSMLGGEPSVTQEITDKIANGNLGFVVPLKTGDNSSLLASTQKMQHNLSNLILQIKTSAEDISIGAQQIAAGNTDLSQRTEEQASSLEETASSMEQMASTVKQNAENAKQANFMANEASEVAIKGGKVVGQVVETMSEINASSKKIVDIIGVIDGIAFQTNILALNAAVEAARAGEQGRGFAVVAAEVRSLAQRSASAAKEIKQLIGDSVEKVNEGTKQVHAAGETMEEIVMAVNMVTDIVNEISAASQEQSTGIDQVNNAITNMDEVTQQNAALVEEAAAAASALEDKAQELIHATSIFKLAEDVAETYEQPKNERLNEMRASVKKELPNQKPTKSGTHLKAPKITKTEDWEEF